MSILGVNGALAGAYQYANRTQKTSTNRTGFTEQLQKTGDSAETSKVDAYTEYLRSKYGNVRIQNVGKDQQSLDRVGKSMNGSDVVIAPNILEQMANDPEKAAYYEGKIDDFFNATPRLKASFAAQGLDYQPCGVVVHDDGKLMLENAMLEASQNRCRALLAKNALEDTGAMALAVGRLTQMAPAGKEYYHKILRAYAETTAQQIEKWGRY